jgi:hypothetical protein
MSKKCLGISASEFSDCFTEIVSRHLSALPAEGQDTRMKNAERPALGASRAERPTTRRVEETWAVPLLSQSRALSSK